MPGLFGNRWFKNVFSLTFGIELMNKFSVNFLPKKYEKIRKKVINSLNSKHNLELVPSDVFLLANSNSELLKEYQRVDGNARICLTEMIDEVFNEKS